MDWLVWITLIAVLTVQAVILRKLNKLDRQMIGLKYDINQFRTRVSHIRVNRNSGKGPQIDAKAYTSTRDSNDLLARGGRMSTGVHRKKTNERESADD